MMFSNSADFEEHSSSRILETLPLSSNREALARKSRTQYVKSWDLSNFDIPNVSWCDFCAEVLVIGLTTVFIPFVGEDTFESILVTFPYISLTVGAIPIGL
jgi:hypothetical protein